MPASASNGHPTVTTFPPGRCRLRDGSQRFFGISRKAPGLPPERPLGIIDFDPATGTGGSARLGGPSAPSVSRLWPTGSLTLPAGTEQDRCAGPGASPLLDG